MPRAAAIVGMVLMLVSGSGFAAAQTSSKAKAAYDAGRYQEALEHYNRALIAKPSPQLSYNRAVTLFKLGRLTEARRQFEALTADPTWRDVAEFNIGLIATKQHDLERASEAFRQVEARTGNAKLKDLASRKLSQLPPSRTIAGTTEPDRRAKQLLVRTGLAHDSNASGLADELARRASDTSDWYWHTLAYVQGYLTGEPAAGIKAYGVAQTRQYQRFEPFDTQVVGIGIERQASYGAWRTELGLRGFNIETGTGKLADQYTLKGQASKPIGDHQLKFSGEYSHFDAGRRYRHLQGSQWRLALAGKLHQGAWRITPGIGYEVNQRRDKEAETSRFSYSPTILSLDLELAWRGHDRWTLTGLLGWDDATYAGDNRLLDLNGEKTQRRRSQKWQWGLQAAYKISRAWRARVEWRSLVADDNFDLYTFEKNLVTCAVEYQWRP